MATEWYYARNKKQLGPVSTARLKELAASGELQPTDKVWKEGIPKWVAAATVAGLFPEGAPAPEEPDEAPRRRKQASGIPVWFWLAGAAVALLLVCGGGISVAVILFTNSGGSGTLNFSFSSPGLQNLDKVKSGMSEQEVQTLLGPGQVVMDMNVPAFGAGKPKHLRVLHWQQQVGNENRRVDISFEDGKCIYGAR